LLDSFAGSGATGDAILGMNKEDGGTRRFILVEMEPHIAKGVTAERVRRVAQGYANAKGQPVEGLGGGFRYCTLSEPLFDARGQLRDKVKFGDLAHHIFFAETGEPLPQRMTGRAPFIGELNGTAYYLLWHGPGSTSVLDSETLKRFNKHDGLKIVYADGCRLSPAQLQTRNIVFKQIPYEVKAG